VIILNFLAALKITEKAHASASGPSQRPLDGLLVAARGGSGWDEAEESEPKG
jgi:hypothetical protein